MINALNLPFQISEACCCCSDCAKLSFFHDYGTTRFKFSPALSSEPTGCPGATSKMLAVRRTDFNEKDHATDGAASAKLNLFELCRVATEDGKTNNLGEVRSLVHELNMASASKRNFVIDKGLTAVEVRLRRTYHLLSSAPSCAHLR